MSLTVDSVSTLGCNAATNPSWSHTVAGSDTLLVVLLPRFQTGASISAVTYNSVALTQSINSGESIGGDQVDIWYLVNPASGTHTIAVTGAAISGMIQGVSWNGAHQTTAVGTGVGTFDSSTSPSIDASSAVTELVIGAMSRTGGGTAVMGANQHPYMVVTNSGELTASSVEQGSSTTTHSYTITSADWAIAALPLKRATTPSPEPPYFIGQGTAAFTATNGATFAPGLPVGWAADDIFVLLAARSDNTTMSSLTGWTQIAGVSGNNTTAQRIEVWWRRAVAGDTAPTVTFGSSTVVRGGVIVGVRGCITSGDPFSTSNRSDNAASATVSFSSLTPTDAETYLLALYGYEDDPTSASQMVGYPPFSVVSTTLGNDMALGVTHRTWDPASTATGALSTTVSGGTFTNSVNSGILLALKPPPAAQDTPELYGRPYGARGADLMMQLLAQ